MEDRSQFFNTATALGTRGHHVDAGNVLFGLAYDRIDHARAVRLGENDDRYGATVKGHDRKPFEHEDVQLSIDRQHHEDDVNIRCQHLNLAGRRAGATQLRRSW